MKIRKKNILPPPSYATFWELFDCFWDNGIGNLISADDEPVSWTAASLADALDHTPSETSILNWRKRKHLPKQEQIQRLCRILLGSEPEARKAWSSALIETRREEEILRKQEKKQAEPVEASVSNYVAAGAAVAINASEVEVGTAEETDTTNKQSIWPLLTICIIVVLSLLFFIGRGENQAVTVPEPSVQNIRFCLERDFSQERLSCNMHQSNFPAGTQKVYVSFETNNIPYGLVFSRRWYRNGEKFLERNDFFDETWQNYTWLFNQNGHDVGEYSMRIILGNKVFTGQFTLGDF